MTVIFTGSAVISYRSSRAGAVVEAEGLPPETASIGRAEAWRRRGGGG